MSELAFLYLAGKYDASFARCPSIKVCADTRLGISERMVADASDIFCTKRTGQKYNLTL